MSSQYCTIYLVRHGETDWNVSKTIQGQKDIPLNQKGEAQAHELSIKLKDIHFDTIYSSDLIRAQRTAEILNLERELAIATTQSLRERSFGLYEGKPMNEAHTRLYTLLESYKNHPHIIESKIETNEQMVSRALTFMREISVANEGKTVLIVSHGGLMRTLLIHLAYCTSQQIPPFGFIKNLAYIKMHCDGLDFIITETEGINILK
jgi:2,3-bisphosphoglycerate-dependent phosphoglycerate mutase